MGLVASRTSLTARLPWPQQDSWNFNTINTIYAVARRRADGGPLRLYIPFADGLDLDPWPRTRGFDFPLDCNAKGARGRRTGDALVPINLFLQARGQLDWVGRQSAILPSLPGRRPFPPRRPHRPRGPPGKNPPACIPSLTRPQEPWLETR